MKKVISTSLGIFSGILISLLYFILAYAVAYRGIPSGVEYYSFSNIALVGFAIMIFITSIIFIVIRKKYFSIALPFAISSLTFGTISLIIISSIKYYF